MGYWLAPGLRNTPDPDEYVRIGPDQLRPRDGRYELRVTNELEETLFLDHGRLLAVDHPEGVEVHPAEGMTREPRRLSVVRGPRPARSPAPPTTGSATGPRPWPANRPALRGGLRAAPAPRLRRAPRVDPRPRGGPRRPQPARCSRPGPTTRSRATTWPRRSGAGPSAARCWKSRTTRASWRPALDVGVPVGRPQTDRPRPEGRPAGLRAAGSASSPTCASTGTASPLGRAARACPSSPGGSTRCRAELVERGFSAR